MVPAFIFFSAGPIDSLMKADSVGPSEVFGEALPLFGGPLPTSNR